MATAMLCVCWHMSCRTNILCWSSAEEGEAAYPWQHPATTHPASLHAVLLPVPPQLLTKIDGVDALNNILLIGMTNRWVAGRRQGRGGQTLCLMLCLPTSFVGACCLPLR